MKFEDFIRQGKVRRTSKNIDFAKSLIKTSRNKRESNKRLELDETTASTKVGILYESVREILEAIASLEGYKIYGHEAFSVFLREIKQDEINSRKFDRFRLIRNGLNYYGKNIGVDEARDLLDDLLDKYLEEVEDEI